MTMTVPGRAVQVLSLINDQQHPSREARLLKLDTQVLRDITGKVDKEGLPLAVIVIAGPERQGKSFILTYIVRYLQALETSNEGVVRDWMEKSNPEISMKDRGFNFENAFQRTTEGIWMWSRPFIIPDPSTPEKRMAVLLMDTEGCYGSSLTNQEQAALVGLSLLTSSVFIYNDSTRINESTVATVGKFMQYGQLASQSFQGKIFQRIMFLIRDWNCPNIFEYGAAGGQGFIREFFREKPRMTKEAFEHRNAILKHFEDCNAYLMPHPGQAVLSDKFSGSVAEMTPEFSFHLENFVTNLIADVRPKMLRDNLVTGSSFASLFQAYVKAFNSNDMPSPASIIKATLYIAFDTEIRSLAESYESSLRIRLTDADSSRRMVTSHQLDQWGRKIADSIVSTFEKKEHQCDKEDKIPHIERLKFEVDRIHKTISEENEASTHQFIKRSAAAADAAFNAFLDNHVKSDDRYWKREEFDAKVNLGLEECLQSLKKTYSSVPSEHIQPIVTDARDKMNKLKEALWTELSAKNTTAEKKTSEVMEEVLDDYICNMRFLIADDVHPEATLEKFHNNEANTAHVSFKCRIETEFKDENFITESTENLYKCLESEYMKFRETNATKLNEIRGEFEEEIGKALIQLKEKLTQSMEGSATLDQFIVKDIYGSILELTLEAFEHISTPDSRFLNEYIRKLRAALKATLDESVSTLAKLIEAKRLQCAQFAQNACRAFNEKLSSWIQTTGTVSPKTFDDHSLEFMQNELSKCEADMRSVMPEYSSYLRKAQELMEEKRRESVVFNSEKILEIENFALRQSQTIKCSYEASLQKSLDQCADLADLQKLHVEISSNFLKEFRLKLESCKALSLYDTHEATCKKEMAESFNEKKHQFLQKTQGLEKLRTQRIPQRVKDLRDRMGDKIRKNPFISEADVDMILQEEWPEVKHSLITEIKSEHTLSSTEFVAVVDEIESQLEETKEEVKQKLRKVREQGDENAESVYQNVLDFALSDLGRVAELLMDGSRNNMEEDFQTLTSQVDSKFENEWPYEACSKKDSIRHKIHSKLEDELGNARLEVPKKISEEAKYVAKSMESVLVSFAGPVVEVLGGGKYISMGKIEDQLMREMDLKMKEFQALLQSNQVERTKYIGEMTQKLKDKKRGILQLNTANLLKVFTDAEDLIRTYCVQSEPENTCTSLDQLSAKAQTAVTAFLAENCDGECDEALRTSLLQSIKDAHEPSIRKLGGGTGAVVKYCQGSVAEGAVRYCGKEKIQIARGQARMAQVEDNRRKKEEADRRERESRRQLARTEIRSPGPSHSENFNKNKDVGNTQEWRVTSEADGKRPSDLRPQNAGASSVATNNRVGVKWIRSLETLKDSSIPSMELAIHIGLYRTHVAFVTPTSGQFHLVANVQNRLYWNEREHQLTPAFDKALPSDRPVINFEMDLALMKERRYDFVLSQQKFSWDLQDVLSLLLVCLKRKAELDLRIEFTACVIAVPQFLNDSQRLRIRQSATIAGFDAVTFVNDTTAIAVVHMVDEEAVTGNVVVVNTQEGPVDVASFVFDHGKLECHGVTGDFFFEDHNGFWSDLKGLVDGLTEPFVGHPKNSAKSYFTQKELRISPSSPHTKYLLLGRGESHEMCNSAICKATYFKGTIPAIVPETIVYGAAYICCLRSRNPYNSVLLKWQDKLQPSSKGMGIEVFDEVEGKILRPERKFKKNMNVTVGYLLTLEEVQHRRIKLNTSKKAELHRDRLALLKLIDSMEKSLVSSDNQVSESIHKHLVSYSKQLFQQDLHPDKLKNIKEGIMALRDSSYEVSGSLV